MNLGSHEVLPLTFESVHVFSLWQNSGSASVDVAFT